MPTALPLVTRQEIVHDFRLEGTGTVDNGIRALREKHALSNGLSFVPRDAGGHLEGRVHLYSALNRDAARAARHKDYALAARLCKAAARLEASPEAKEIVAALRATASSISSTADLARLLADPQLAAPVSGLQRKLARARRGLKDDLLPAQFAGRVVAMSDIAATVELDGLPSPVTMPTKTLTGAGVGAVGCAIVARWEMLIGGRTVISIEPAIDMPDVNDLGESLVDLYGTPWGQVLGAVDPAHLASPGQPTIRIPAGIPDVE